MKPQKMSLKDELRHFSERAWVYGERKAVRARRSANDRVIKFYSVRGYYLGEVYGGSIFDVDETMIKSQVFDSKGQYK